LTARSPVSSYHDWSRWCNDRSDLDDSICLRIMVVAIAVFVVAVVRIVIAAASSFCPGAQSGVTVAGGVAYLTSKQL